MNTKSLLKFLLIITALLLFNCNKIEPIDNLEDTILTKCEYRSTYLETENLRGAVKKIEHRSFQATSNFEKEERAQIYSWEYDFIMHVDSSGRILVLDWISAEDYLIYRDKYKYDDFGRLTERTGKFTSEYIEYDDLGRERHRKDIGGNTALECSIEYLSDSRIVKECKEYDEYAGIIEITIDSLSREKLQINIDADGNEFKSRTSYNEFWDVIGIVEYDSNEDTLEYTKYIYDNYSKILQGEEWYLYDEGQLDGWIITEYNAMGDEVLVEEYDVDLEKEVDKIVYKYDSCGNWILQRVNINDEKYYVIERKIEYFE